jgi:hypothetical protein
MDTRTQFLDQFDNPHVRAAAEKALNRRTINLEARAYASKLVVIQ